MTGNMKSDTIAVHGGYETEPTTRAVAVPIYQTVAYEFESADHGAALFNLEVEGHRYSRISNPTTAVLERRIAELEGGVEALCTSTGQAALNYAILNLADMGTNIVSVPQLYGTTHTLFAHLLPSQGITVRFAESDTADAIEKLIDDNTRAIFCESIGNPAGNICDIEALAKVAKRRGIPLVVDNTVATPILLRPIDYGADIVVHSLTKFLGGHGTTLGRGRRRCLRQRAGRRLAVRLLSGPSGVRHGFALARISPRRRPFPAQRGWQLSGSAAELFQQCRDVSGRRFPRARHGRAARRSGRRFSGAAAGRRN